MTLPDTEARKALFADPGTLFSRATDLVSADLSGDMAILNLQTKTYFGLADVGAFIWQQLEVSTNFRTILNALMNEFEVNESQCAADLEKFLDKLIQIGLLTANTAMK